VLLEHRANGVLTPLCGRKLVVWALCTISERRPRTLSTRLKHKTSLFIDPTYRLLCKAMIITPFEKSNLDHSSFFHYIILEMCLSYSFTICMSITHPSFLLSYTPTLFEGTLIYPRSLDTLLFMTREIKDFVFGERRPRSLRERGGVRDV
jgi:hypothetical protein